MSDIQELQEIVANLQAELNAMSGELYRQQKEITALTIQIGYLNDKLKSVQQDSGILHSDEDTPPPHYWLGKIVLWRISHFWHQLFNYSLAILAK